MAFARQDYSKAYFSPCKCAESGLKLSKLRRLAWVIGWCQANANQSPKFAHKQVSDYKKVAPFAKRGVPAGFEV